MSDIVLTIAEEDYIKAIFKISEKDTKAVHTKSIAQHMGSSAAAVTDMLQRLAAKGIVHYEKYYGVTLTTTGQKAATSLLRRQRLWEVFLVDKLRFPWHQVNQIADHLEHVADADLVLRLEAFLDYPKFDPHGDPIPNAEGRFTIRNQTLLSEFVSGQAATILGVKDDSDAFLHYLTSIGIKPGVNILVKETNAYEGSMLIEIDHSGEKWLSKETVYAILVKGKS
jgi:DtxR family transcriptional regulator, Mn-dependent transcriptional regulator